MLSQTTTCIQYFLDLNKLPRSEDQIHSSVQERNWFTDCMDEKGEGLRWVMSTSYRSAPGTGDPLQLMASLRQNGQLPKLRLIV